jgi:hypothetical protein
VGVPVVEPTVRDLCRALVEVDDLAPGMAERIRSEVPLYGEAGGVLRKELDESCRDNLRYVLGNLAGRPGIGIASNTSNTSSSSP